MNKWVPEQPSPWRKSWERESCYGDRVHFPDMTCEHPSAVYCCHYSRTSYQEAFTNLTSPLISSAIRVATGIISRRVMQIVGRAVRVFERLRKFLLLSIYIYIYIYMYTHTYIYLYTYIHTYIYDTCIWYMCIYSLRNINSQRTPALGIYLYLSLSLSLSLSIYIHVYIYIYIYMLVVVLLL